LGIGQPDHAARFINNIDHPNRFHAISLIVCDALLQVIEPQKKKGAFVSESGLHVFDGDKPVSVSVIAHADDHLSHHTLAAG
jgi:hypothetical protein